MEVLKKIRVSTRTNVLERIDDKLTPYLRDPVSLIGNYKIQWLGVVGPTQSGKSVFLQTAVADAIDQDPGPCLYILPDENTGKKHLDEKLISMINASPALNKHKTSRVRDFSYERICMQHMTIYPAWAGSPQTINSFPMKRVFLDEVRLMGLTIGNDSNAIKLAGDRLTTYFGFGLGQGYMVSSPSVEGDLLHQQLSVPGTLYVSWQVPCPRCGEFQELDFFVNIRVIDGKRACYCRYCNEKFDDSDRKQKINSKGMYAVVKYENNVRRPTKIFKDGTREVPFVYGEGHNRVFFDWNSMDSPFRSYSKIWTEFVQTKDKPHDYKNFWQCWLNRFWVEDKSKASIIGLEANKHPYRKKTVPAGVKILTAGIDTQDKGFYVVIRGWGSRGFSCLVDEFFIPCSIHTSMAEEIEKLFKDLIFNRVIDGWKVAIGAIDTGGHRTRQLYKACASIYNLILCKGATENQMVTIHQNSEGLYLVRTSEYLEETDIRAAQDNWWLPEDISRDYLNQFINRRKTEPPKNKNTGEAKIVWKKMGQDDYRYAEVHAILCLDIPVDLWGNLREKLDVDDFIKNPFAEEQALQQAHMTAKAETDRYVEGDDDDDYDIPDIRW